MRIKEIKGITLIALIVTIIVLIIIAGVSISMLTGDNGIIIKINEAKIATDEASGIEKIRISVMDTLTNRDIQYSSEDFKTELYNNLQNNFGGNYELNYDKSDDVYEITLNKETKYCLYSSGEILQKGNAKDITSSDFGKYVNYGVNYTATETEKNDKWEIFYADENNVYLISQGNTGNLPIIRYIGDYTDSNMLKDSKRFPMANKWLNCHRNTTTNEWYFSNAECIKGVLYLLDSENVWNKKYKNNYASYVVGAPTLELLLASYDVERGGNTDINELVTTSLKQEKDNEGIVIKQWYEEQAHIRDFDTTNSTQNGRRLWDEGTYDYWLASTIGEAHLWTIRKNRGILSAPYSNYDYYGIRPIVCLKPSVKFDWNEITQSYDLYQ